MSARARRHTTLFSLGILALLVPLLWKSGLFAAVFAAPAAPTPTPEHFEVVLIRSGLDAKALAAAGVSSGSIASVLQAASAEASEAPSALSQADATYATWRVEADRLERLITAGKGTQEDVAAYQTAKANLASATSARAAILDGYFAAGIEGLASGQRTALTKIRANRSWELPLEFLVVDREEAEWVQVRDALANERIAVDLPDTLSQAAQQSLAGWRANASVAAAKASFDANLASVTSAWNSSASGD